MVSSYSLSHHISSRLQRTRQNARTFDYGPAAAQSETALPQAAAFQAPATKEGRRRSIQASIQRDALEWFNKRQFEGAAITLTFVSSRFLREHIAERTVSELLKRLDKFARGRGKKRPLWSIAIREGGTKNSGTHLHYHMKIEVPDGMDAQNFVQKIEHYWTKLRWTSAKQNWFTAESDSGWISYILKIRTKPNYADAIDWNNTRLPDPERLPSALEEPAR